MILTCSNRSRVPVRSRVPDTGRGLKVTCTDRSRGLLSEVLRVYWTRFRQLSVFTADLILALKRVPQKLVVVACMFESTVVAKNICTPASTATLLSVKIMTKCSGLLS